MYDKHLDTFIAVAESGSFSAAAQKQYISRTALIQQINLLEAEIGVQLFIRDNKGVTLTEAGSFFLSEAKRIIKLANHTVQRCRSMQEQNTVRIGTLPNFSSILLAKICHDFLMRYPEYQVRFSEYPLQDYFRKFQEGCFDVTAENMLSYINHSPDFCTLKIMEDRLCCGVPKTHPLAGKASITAEDLEGQTLVMYRQGTTYAYDRFRAYLLQHAPNVEIIDIAAYDRLLFLECELSGRLLLYYSMYYKDFDPLVAVPLDVDIPVDIGLGYHSSTSAAVAKFIATAEAFQNIMP